MSLTAPVNSIIPMSLVDGPGSRTAIFFQGCNFDCVFCHNPETINMCNHCGICVKTCPTNALSMVDGKVVWDEEVCINCDTCIEVCPYDASPKIKRYTVDRLVAEIKKNIPFITGITVSGGEATLQWKFLEELFTETKKLGLTNLVDTNGYIPLDNPNLKGFVDVTDGFMLDIKSTDKVQHLELTSKPVDNIIANAKYLASIDKLAEVRTILIKGYKNLETVTDVINLIKDYDNIDYKLISYRSFGVRAKYLDLESVDREEKDKLLKLVASYDINVIDI